MWTLILQAGITLIQIFTRDKKRQESAVKSLVAFIDARDKSALDYYERAGKSSELLKRARSRYNQESDQS